MNTEPAAPSVSQSPTAEASAADVDLILLKREVDALQVVVHGQRVPWYLNVSTLLSVIALVFSFGTTYVSYVRTGNQDIQALRVELRSLLQRLAALPKENVEMIKKYETDPAAIAAIGGFLNQENAMLARQAAEIARKMPSEYISATEYYAVAVALQFAYNNDAAREFFTKAINIAADMNDRVAGLRSRANLLFISGQPEAGRVDYQRALNVFSEVQPKYNDYTQKSTHIISEMGWAYSEAGVGAKEEALQHLRNAENYVSALLPGPGTQQLRNQVLQARAIISGNHPLPGGGTVLSPAVMPGGSGR